RPRQPPLQPPRHLDDRPPDTRPHLRLPRRPRRQIPRVPASVAERVFLPHHLHHGVLSQRLSGGLCAHRRSETGGNGKPYPAIEGWRTVSAHHLQDHQFVFATETVCTNRDGVLFRWYGLVWL